MSVLAKRLLWLAIILVIIGALAVPKLLTSGEGPRAGGAPGGGRAGGMRGDTMLVDAYVLAPRHLVNRIITQGAVRANESVDLVSEASGKLIDIMFEEGARVRKGQLVVKINDADLVAQRERAKYRLELAQKREERQRLILKQGGISQEEYDMALSEVNVLQAEIQVIDAQIAKTEIRAPFEGVIGLRYVSEGSFISPQTRIATLNDLDPIKIDFPVPEKYAGVVRVGDNIQFKVPGKDEVYRARVYAIEPNVNQNTRTLQLRALTGNPGHTLVPGGFADIELILEELDGALAVPAISVVPEMDSKRVFVVEKGKAASRTIDTGMRTDSAVQVLKGLAPGDTVIVSGIQQLRPGIPVKVTAAGQ